MANFRKAKDDCQNAFSIFLVAYLRFDIYILLQSFTVYALRDDNNGPVHIFENVFDLGNIHISQSFIIRIIL